MADPKVVPQQGTVELPVSAPKKKKGNTLEEFLKQRRSYILGIFVGLVLIVINTYVSLYMLDILLSEDEI
ncbi:hypothetical protein KC640_00235, partial [Candidatus Dojkabacteria bacterium]|nr:hypothetical protein [Candidatus Dojkabacteria bacterium]